MKHNLATDWTIRDGLLDLHAVVSTEGAFHAGKYSSNFLGMLSIKNCIVEILVEYILPVG